MNKLNVEKVKRIYRELDKMTNEFYGEFEVAFLILERLSHLIDSTDDITEDLVEKIYEKSGVLGSLINVDLIDDLEAIGNNIEDYLTKTLYSE